MKANGWGASEGCGKSRVESRESRVEGRGRIEKRLATDDWRLSWAGVDCLSLPDNSKCCARVPTSSRVSDAPADCVPSDVRREPGHARAVCLHHRPPGKGGGGESRR